MSSHAELLRDFGGDTVHASTLQVLAELDLLAGLEKLPQQRTTNITLMTDSGVIPLGDFTRLPGDFQCLSMVLQWDFPNFLPAAASRKPAFSLYRQVEVTGLLETDAGGLMAIGIRNEHLAAPLPATAP